MLVATTLETFIIPIFRRRRVIFTNGARVRFQMQAFVEVVDLNGQRFIPTIIFTEAVSTIEVAVAELEVAAMALGMFPRRGAIVFTTFAEGLDEAAVVEIFTREAEEPVTQTRGVAITRVQQGRGLRVQATTEPFTQAMVAPATTSVGMITVQRTIQTRMDTTQRRPETVRVEALELALRFRSTRRAGVAAAPLPRQRERTRVHAITRMIEGVRMRHTTVVALAETFE